MDSLSIYCIVAYSHPIFRVNNEIYVVFTRYIRLAPSAMAMSPAAFHPETMTTFDGQAVVDRDVLNAAFEDLTSDLSGILAAPLQFPAKTLGSMV